MRLSTFLTMACALVAGSAVANAQSLTQSNSPLDRASTARYVQTGKLNKGLESPDFSLTPGSPSVYTSGRDFTEGFDSFPAAIAAGWAQQNLSAPVGTTTWRQGAGTTTFPGNSGGDLSYAAANFNSTGSVGTISDWLFTPQTALENGTVIRFFTRTITAAPFADRLEVRLSTAGASVNAGATATSVGDFTTLLLTINPNLATGPGGNGANGYPDAWTEFTATVSGLAAPTNGRFAFRYFVTSGGANGANSNYIGLDDVRVTVAAPSGPVLSVSPGTVAFPVTMTGMTATQDVTLTNNGTAPVNISSIALTGGAAFTATGTAAGTLAVGETRTVTITFAPTAGGAQTATLTITSNAPGSPQTVAITGTGNADVTTAIPPGTTIGGPTWNRTSTVGTGAAGSCTVASGTAPGVGVNYSRVTFNVTATGPYTITTDYRGNTPPFDGFIHLYQGSFDPAAPCVGLIALDDDFLIGGTGTSAFLASQIANIALTAGSYTLVVSAYEAPDTGTYIGTVVGAGAVTFAAAPAALSVTPTAVAFNNVAVGATSTREVTIRNTGGTPIALASVTYTGSAAITASTVAAGTLAPGDTRTVTLTFAPTVAGPVTGTLTVTSDAPGSPVTVAITGTGVTQPAGGLRFVSLDTPLPIPDNSTTGVTSTITLPATAGPMFGDLDVELNITHSYVSDLDITLTHSGVSAVLVAQPGRPAIATGCPANNMNVILDDEGTLGTIEDSCSPGDGDEAYVNGGRYTPDNPLSQFLVPAAPGAWTLFITDSFGADTGTLDSWALVFRPLTAGEGTATATASRLAVAPNPVQNSAQIDLTVGTTQDVRVALYDALGREVSVLFDRSMTAGQQAFISMTTAGLPSGVYVVRATGTDLSLTQRVTVIR